MNSDGTTWTCKPSGCGAGSASAHAQTVADNCAVATCAVTGANPAPAKCTQCNKDFYLDTKVLVDSVDAATYKTTKCKAVGDTCYCDNTKPD